MQYLNEGLPDPTPDQRRHLQSLVGKQVSMCITGTIVGVGSVAFVFGIPQYDGSVARVTLPAFNALVSPASEAGGSGEGADSTTGQGA